MDFAETFGNLQIPSVHELGRYLYESPSIATKFTILDNSCKHKNHTNK